MTSPAYEYGGLAARPLPGLPCWYAVDGLRRQQGESITLHFALFDDADGPVRVEVHWLRRDSDISIARLWRRGSPETLLWSRQYQPSEPGWHPYRDVMAEVVKVTGRPLPSPLQEHVEQADAESNAS